MNKGNMWVVIVVVIALIAGGLYYFSTQKATAPVVDGTETATSTDTTHMMEGATVPTDGSYTVSASESTFAWAGAKPLIEGYVDSGTIALKDGSITIASSTATGSFAIAMDTLQVGLTAKKPGQEGALEKHLKSKDFFDVATYPTVTFEITKVTPQADSATSHTYDVTGNLTMKGKTNPITFPAMIYMMDGKLIAEAAVNVDRTKWGITYGSGSFFDNLADNAISDTFTLTFKLVATKSE